MNVLVGSIALALGAFVASSPIQAAAIWGGKRFANMPPERRGAYVWWFRVLGFAMGFAGILVALDSTWKP